MSVTETTKLVANVTSYLEDGQSYIIVNRATQSVMELRDGGKGNGNPVQGAHFRLVDEEQVLRQIWKVEFTSAQGGYQWMRFYNAASQTVLNRSSSTSTTDVTGWIEAANAATGEENQEWRIRPSKASWEGIQTYM